MGDSVSSLVVSFSPCFGVLRIFLIFQTLSIVRTGEYLIIGSIIPDCQISTELNNSGERERRIQPAPSLALHCDFVLSTWRTINNLRPSLTFTYTAECSQFILLYVQGAALTNDIFSTYWNSSYSSLYLEININHYLPLKIVLKI